ncbi:MAG: NAD(P)H-binding protein, partial [Chloroflexota bacterium]
MILVTGAGGKTGRTICQKLVDAGLQVRAWLRRPDESHPATEQYIGDMSAAADWQQACAGISKIYQICP